MDMVHKTTPLKRETEAQFKQMLKEINKHAEQLHDTQNVKIANLRLACYFLREVISLLDEK